MQLSSYTPQADLAAETLRFNNSQGDAAESDDSPKSSKGAAASLEHSEASFSGCYPSATVETRQQDTTQNVPSLPVLYHLSNDVLQLPTSGNAASDQQKLLLLQGLLANSAQAPVNLLNQPSLQNRDQGLANNQAAQSMFPSLFSTQQQRNPLLPSDLSASQLLHSAFSRNVDRQRDEAALLQLMFQLQQGSLNGQNQLAHNHQHLRDWRQQSQGRPPF
jgi:hypothetical protein